MTTTMAAQAHDSIPGVHPDLVPRLRAACLQLKDISGTPATVSDVLSRRPGSPMVLLRYDRSAAQDGSDVTSWLPSTRHMDYLAKGWVAIELREA